ncbi:HAD family hydrolase [Salicibibacter cibarius]|uniref:HAD family hydrolase n=1 Tax=Salicibibacter cibarius TaxID=2743000 RepID=UPI001B7D8E6E|nr:HAD-IA family hydrolase [Salicibibacter cibarius]
MFDKDGTLLDLHLLWSSWFHQLLVKIKNKQPGVMFSDGEVAKDLGVDIEQHLILPRGPLAIGTMQDSAIIVALHLYRQKLPWNEAVQTVRNSMEDVNATIDWNRYLQPLQGLISFLEKASQNDVQMAVVTSDDTDIAEEHLHLLNIHHFFHSIIGSDQIDRPKPFPDIGHKACQKLMVDPAHVAVIGDTNGDMNLGDNLNAKVNIGIVAHDDPNASHLTDADHIIHDYGELSIHT